MPPHLLHPRPSNSRTKQSCPGVKLAPPIQQARIISFERRTDQKIWFLIDVDPQQLNVQVTSRLGPKILTRRTYTIARRYEDFTQFSQRLHDTFSCGRLPLGSIGRSEKHKANHDLLELPKVRSRLQILPNKQIHIQRRAELNRFVHALFRLPANITQSLLVLEFFGLQKADTEDQLWRDQQKVKTPSKSRRARSHSVAHHRSSSAVLPKSMSQPNLRQASEALVAGEMRPQPSGLDKSRIQSQMHGHTFHPSQPSRWKRLRCPSIRAPLPSASSSSSLSSFCSHAATMMMPWTTRTPAVPLPNSVALSISMASSSSTSSSCTCTSLSSSSSRTTTATTPTPTPTPSPSQSTLASPTLQLIKIKVVYDADNIIVIQVARSIDFSELHQRIAQKLADPTMGSIQFGKDPLVLFHPTASSTASTASSSASSFSTTPTLDGSIPSAGVVVSSQENWDQLMKTQWSHLDKVTLRCI
ncbi:hypothetical protein BDF14DRAFT_1799431 [Spinellus fusiger]|nr:hypothetical protein BDF14DRAFT_1799431 [Spinellus fusiger]